jgi:hypothetical protein
VERRSPFFFAYPASGCGTWPSGTPAFFALILTAQHRLLQFLLLVREQSVNAAVCLVAYRVDLRTELLARSIRILVEQRLDFVVVLLQQGFDLLLLLFPG